MKACRASLALMLASAPAVGLTLPQGERLESPLLTQLERRIEGKTFRRIRSVLVVKDGQLVYESYFNDADAELLQDIRSAGKSITSILMGIAVDQGFVSGAHEALLPYFPEYDGVSNPDGRKGRITLEDALTMRLGLDVSDGDYSRGSYGNVETYGPNWTADVLGSRVVADPGTVFDYSSAASSLCGPVIARASGMSVPDFAARYLFEPLGITDYRWTFFPDGSACTAGSFWVRPRDFAKLGLLMVRNGRWGDERIVSPEWVAQSTVERMVVAPWIGIGYGYYWWHETYLIDDRRIPCFYAQGNGGNRMHVFPTEDLVIVVTANAYMQPYMFDQVRAMIYTFVLPAAILPRERHAASVPWASVPQAGLAVAGAVLLSAIVLWPSRAIRRRKHGEPSAGTEGPAGLRYLTRGWAFVGALVHLLFVVLVFMSPSFELFLNTGYEYVIPVQHLVLNWLIMVFAVGTALLAVVVWGARLWSAPDRGHYTLVAAAGLYLLYLLVRWDALILS